MLKRLDGPETGRGDTLHPDRKEPASFDFLDAINFAWRNWKFIAGVAALAVLIGGLYIARQTPLYTATAQLLLDPNKEKAGAQDSMLAGFALDLPAIESQIQVIRSTSLLSRVVRQDHLVTDPEFGAATPVVGSRGLLGPIRAFFSPAPAPAPSAAPAGRDELGRSEPPTLEVAQTVQNVMGAVGVSRNGQSLVLNVSFTSADPAKAVRLANAIADAYVIDKLDARFEAAKRASAWLSDRLVDLRKQLRESEEAVARFRSDNNLIGAGGGNVTLNQDQLGQLNGRRVAARAETADKKARLDLLLQVQAAGGSVADLPDIANAGAIPELRQQENDLMRQAADLLARYSDRHPSVVNIHAQLADLRRSIAREAERLAADVKHDYDMALARQQAIEKTLNEVTGETDLDASKAITLRELERNAAVDKTLFEEFLQRAKVTEEQSTFEARDARVITPAQPPAPQTSPRTMLVLGASLVLGLAAGVGGAFVVELLNPGFTTPRQVEEFLDLPLLASIALMETRDLTNDGVLITMPEYPFVKPLSRFSEAFRSLRSAVQMSDVDNPPKVLLVTSTVPSEGKSTIAMTTAASAARSGLRTLIVEGDLRHPTVSRYFNAADGPGLVDHLVYGAELSSVVLRDEKLQLWVLPAGAKTQNPPDLLGSDRFRALIAELREQYDLILIDSPPLGPVVDALIVSQLVDKTLFVVRWASTPREMVAHSVERLASHRKVAGVVFNYVVHAQAQKYGKYAYSYYYGDRYYKKYYTE
ncbi:exopolysaccharide transport family protein [Roseiarcus fermentans]|uniref:Exopolysaccharide transport family protein n=1 Tax=Roseiarcus fermentans TaxID=1473586 RepID=A0A366F0S5_9HYPH|nr:polysaccharide biosynthesis tyrosine autokinase [Roseiarcus fermentans]RBP07329.1 exopolysaccharide transport family protein [Roseiarcus fermentans]